MANTIGRNTKAPKTPKTGKAQTPKKKPATEPLPHYGGKTVKTSKTPKTSDQFVVSNRGGGQPVGGSRGGGQPISGSRGGGQPIGGSRGGGQPIGGSRGGGQPSQPSQPISKGRFN